MPDTFEAPIPGQALTGELGSKLWEQPAKYDTVEEALDFYLTRLSDMDISMQLFESVDDGLPITTAVDLVLASGNMDGLHTMDVATLAAPVLAEFMVAICEKLDLNFTMEGEETTKIDKAQLSKAMDEISYDYMKPEVEEEVMVVEEPKEPTGLMSRGGA
jgi:hypothetical protein|tara:strand:- start:771 stop:1250 length:480 start_codon:yes stop_codon:yes gene_type:complete